MRAKRAITATHPQRPPVRLRAEHLGVMRRAWFAMQCWWVTR